MYMAVVVHQCIMSSCSHEEVTNVNSRAALQNRKSHFSEFREQFVGKSILTRKRF
jgi:hypothetical protein